MAHAQALAPEDAYDSAAAEAFAERLAGAIDTSASVLMISVGHKSGLFDALAELPPADVAQIAETACLNERYVREWLAAMVTSGIVRFDPATQTYALPAEHAACLTRNAPLGDMGVAASAFPLMSAVQDRILECLETGDGTRYEEYPCFHHFMAEDSGQTVVAPLFDTILPLAPGLAERLEQGIDVLDAGCGVGRALIAMAERFPKSRFVGYDLCADAIALARKSADAAGVGNVRFEVRDLTGFDDRDVFDFVASFDAVHDQKDPQGLVRGLYGALRPGGVYLMQDIGGSATLENNLDFPMATFLYTVSFFHCTPVSIGQGGAGLGTMWGWETAEAMLGEAGFADTTRHVLEHDPMNVWFVSYKR